MMKEMLERVFKDKLLTSCIAIDNQVLKSRKKVAVFSGVDTKSYYHVVFSMGQKSRFILKNVQEIVELERQLVLHVGHNYKYKHIVLSGPLCTKARLSLVQSGWKVYDDIV